MDNFIILKRQSTKGKLAAEENNNIKVKYHFQNEISSFPWLSASLQI
jgi:hypothetical protein